MLYVEIGTVAVLIFVNGLLAMSELAIVSSRPARLKAMIDRERARAPAARLALGANPGRFLSTVQIGITLVGVLSGAFSGATLGQRLGDLLIGYGRSGRHGRCARRRHRRCAHHLRLADHRRTRSQADRAAQSGRRSRSGSRPAMTVLAKVAAPLVWLLDVSGRAVLCLLGQRDESEEKVTDEEIKMLVAEAEHHGTIESDERRMIAGVMRLGDRAVRAVMTPRTEVDWLNLEADEAHAAKAADGNPAFAPAGRRRHRRRHGRRHPDARGPGGATGRQAVRSARAMCAPRRSCTTRPTRSTC